MLQQLSDTWLLFYHCVQKGKYITCFSLLLNEFIESRKLKPKNKIISIHSNTYNIHNRSHLKTRKISDFLIVGVRHVPFLFGLASRLFLHSGVEENNRQTQVSNSQKLPSTLRTFNVCREVFFKSFSQFSLLNTSLQYPVNPLLVSTCLEHKLQY